MTHMLFKESHRIRTASHPRRKIGKYFLQCLVKCIMRILPGIPDSVPMHSTSERSSHALTCTSCNLTTTCCGIRTIREYEIERSEHVVHDGKLGTSCGYHLAALTQTRLSSDWARRISQDPLTESPSFAFYVRGGHYCQMSRSSPHRHGPYGEMDSPPGGVEKVCSDAEKLRLRAWTLCVSGGRGHGSLG